jgi:ADP-ribosylglycohydrolase
MTPEGAIGTAIDLLKTKEGSMECVTLLQLALALPAKGKATPETIEKIGGGWTAREALAIAIYSALVGEGDFRKGVLFAVNHSGDSDSTGSIAGNILGTMLGDKAIPEPWLKHLELRDVIAKLAKDLHTGFEETDRWGKEYPGF